MLITHLMETMTLSSLPWSRLAALSHASSTSPETSPGSTDWKSTRTSSGSTLLTSILLVPGISDGLSAPSRRGVAGVLGLLVEVGVPGTGARIDLGFTVVLVRDSEEMGALYFLCVDERIFGVVARANLASRSEIEPLEDVEDDDSGRLGVKGAGLVGLPTAGVLGTAMLELVVNKRSRISTFGCTWSRSSPDRCPLPCPGQTQAHGHSSGLMKH
jgi:hypothetical protein